MGLPKSVMIYEEGPREGFQIEKQPIATDAKVRLIDALSETGVRHIQVGSFVDPRRVPSMADVDSIVQRMKVVPGVEYCVLWMNERGMRKALEYPQLNVDGKLRLYWSEAFLNAANLAQEIIGHQVPGHVAKGGSLREIRTRVKAVS